MKPYHERTPETVLSEGSGGNDRIKHAVHRGSGQDGSEAAVTANGAQSETQGQSGNESYGADRNSTKPRKWNGEFQGSA